MKKKSIRVKHKMCPCSTFCLVVLYLSNSNHPNQPTNQHVLFIKFQTASKTKHKNKIFSWEIWVFFLASLLRSRLLHLRDLQDLQNSCKILPVTQPVSPTKLYNKTKSLSTRTFYVFVMLTWQEDKVLVQLFSYFFLLLVFHFVVRRKLW